MGRAWTWLSAWRKGYISRVKEKLSIAFLRAQQHSEAFDNETCRRRRVVSSRVGLFNSQLFNLYFTSLKMKNKNISCFNWYFDVKLVCIGDIEAEGMVGMGGEGGRGEEGGVDVM